METSETEPSVVGVRITADASQMQAELGRATGYGRLFTSTLIQAFDGLAGKGKGFNAVLGQLSLSLSSLVLRAAFKPLEQGFSEVLSGVIGSVGPSATAFARGGVLSAGLPVPFASGGVIASPITFPLADGRQGLAGERGAEAIMPLSRGPDGRLGVALQGGGAAGPSIVFHISTPDADSFRRSETQVAAMVARAASIGQRNL